MQPNDNFSTILDSLGGTKLNVKARKDRDSNNTTVNKNIENIEKKFNARIPPDYLRFTREISAITFNDPVYSRSQKKIPVANNKVSVDHFFDFADDGASIIKVLDNLKSNVPEHVLPICEGEAGDLIVIDMSLPYYGQVFYWYHESMDETEGLYPLAKDFNQFIERLFNETEEEVSTEDVTITKVSDKFLDRLKRAGKI